MTDSLGVASSRKMGGRGCGGWVQGGSSSGKIFKLLWECNMTDAFLMGISQLGGSAESEVISCFVEIELLARKKKSASIPYNCTATVSD